jgi:U3 small nucleolar RNA-associated protein 11
MASQGALRHVVRRREHRERAQPAARAARFGLLEKHKDYKLRAVDYHRKQDALQKLREKASFRNEDEFYMAMNKSQTKKGVHTLTRDSTISTKVLKSMKSQDAAYLQMKRSSDTKRIEQAKQNMHFLMEDEDEEPYAGAEGEEDETEPVGKGKSSNKSGGSLGGKGKGRPRHEMDDDSDEDDEVPTAKKRKVSAAESAIKSKHVIFVDSADAVKSFTPASYFQTTPALARRTFNRLKSSQLMEGSILLNDTRGHAAAASAAAAASSGKASVNPATSAHRLVSDSKSAQESSALLARRDQSLLASYAELGARIQRKKRLDEAIDKLQLEKHLSGKGRRTKVVSRDDQFGEETKTVYKWKMERKK